MTSPSPSEPRTGHQLYHGAPLTPARAIALTAAAVATLYAVQLATYRAGLISSVLSDITVIALVLGFARKKRLSLAQLGIARTTPRFIAAAVLLGISAWYVTMFFVVLINPPGDTSKLEKVVQDTPFVPALFALTIMPALAEELVFRGVLARSLAGRLRPTFAIALSAAVFGAYHLIPAQMLTTFLLGLVLGYVTLRSRSIIPSIIVHALNNTVAVLLTRDEVPGLGRAHIAYPRALIAYPAVTLAAATLCIAGGLGLAAKGVA
jgi:uncharacterized protein